MPVFGERARVATIFAAVLTLVVAGAVSERRSRADGAPRVPTDRAEVLERLPASLGRDRSELEARERAALEAPNDAAAIAAYVERAVVEARRTGDPRWLGRARAVMGPYWLAKAAPDKLVLLRATIKQSLHDFEGALADLDALTVTSPGDPQVWLTRATVLFVLARYDAARDSCARLAPLASPVIVTTCAATIDSVTGQAQKAYDALLPLATTAARDLLPWALSTLGEVALRRGDAAAAEKHFREALAKDAGDRYTRGALADLMLDANRPQEASALLTEHTDDDGLLLRLAIAETRSQSPSAEARRRSIYERHEAARGRGDAVHLREEARYFLDLTDDAARALELARRNFAVQKEPWDTRLVLDAALRARAPAAAADAIALVRSSRTEEPALRRLAAGLGAP